MIKIDLNIMAKNECCQIRIICFHQEKCNTHGFYTWKIVNDHQRWQKVKLWLTAWLTKCHEKFQLTKHWIWMCIHSMHGYDGPVRWLGEDSDKNKNQPLQWFFSCTATWQWILACNSWVSSTLICHHPWVHMHHQMLMKCCPNMDIPMRQWQHYLCQIRVEMILEWTKEMSSSNNQTKRKRRKCHKWWNGCMH